MRANEADVNVSFAGTGFRVLRVVLMGQRGTTLGAPAAGLRTFADEVDSDGDGLEDGEETPGFWLEAEHFAVGDPVRLVEAGASNGVAIEAAAGAPLFSLGVGDWGFESNQFYSVFVRARRTDDFVLETTPQVSAQGSSSNACDSVDSDICGFGSCVFDEGDAEFFCDTSPTGAPRTAFAVEADYEWRFAGAYRVDDTIDRFPIVIREGADATARWAIDRVAILPRLFREDEVVTSYDELGVVESARVLGVGGTTPLTFRAEVPWGLSDPMEADTDGDGVREMDGAIAGSVGWLTDGAERALRLNPFDRDSDLDARFGSADDDPADDFTTIGLSGGVALPAGGPDGRADYGDDTDPSPRPLDRDRDGVTDGVEDLAQLAALQEACFVANSCTGPCAACPDTDYDDETDLAGICGAGLDPCWSDDDDRDDDGLTDGQEDGNRNGRQDFGETNPDSADSDGDCIPDGVEAGLACPQGTGTVFRTGANTAGCTGPFTFGPVGFEPAPSSGVRTSPTQTDSDGDGLSDGDGSDGMGVGGVGPGSGEDQNCNGQQDAGETDPSRSDTDSDLLSDGDEVTGPTNPLVFDTDDDGLGDGEEVLQYLTNPLLEDTDMDRLTDSEEVRPPEGTPATDPTNDDTDGDGLEDGEELLGDGALAGCEWEEVCGTTGDCISPAPCTFGPTNPTRVDTDGDGDTDGAEVSVTGPSNPRRTNPNRADTDGDGISDRDERLGTGPLAPFGPGNPIDSDSDGDGFLDLTEIENGSDPTSGTSLPSTLELSPGGVVIDGATFAPTPTGLVATGRVPLSCGGRAATAFVDGSVELIREGGGYRVVASGDFIVPGAGAREETLWTGEAILAGDQRTFEPGTTTARLSELTLAGGGYTLNLDPPSCTVDADCPSGAEGSCQLGTCEGVNGADGFQVCAGEIIDRAATINLPAPTEDPMMSAAGPRDSDVRYLSDAARVRLPTERLLMPMMRQVSGHDPGMFPWEGRTCFRDPNPVRISASMFGDFNFSPNPNVPIGSVPPPGEPAFNFGGVGGLNLPDVGPVDIMPSVADVDFDIPTGQFDFGTSFPFGVPLGDFGGLPGGPGAFVQTANLRVPEGNRCRWDAGRGMYSCEFEYTRESRPAGGGPRVRQFTFRGRIDVHTHGQIPFQSDMRHDFAGLSCGEGIDTCQDGHAAFNGVLEVPIKKIPGVDLVIEGDVVSDVTTRDGDDLFLGAFATVRFEQRILRAIAQSGYAPFPFPFHIEVGQATTVFDFEGDELQTIAFHTTKGFQLTDLVDIPGLPRAADTLFDPFRGNARGCIDVETGRMEGLARIYPGFFPFDIGFVMTPPFNTDGEPDLSAGSLGGSGSVLFPPDFGVDLKATVEGEIGFDGRFRFAGTFDDDFKFPGLPELPLPDATFEVTNDGARIAGDLPLPGLGELEASGSITASGNFDVQLQGELAPAGIPLSSVRGFISRRSGAILEGDLALPVGGVVARVRGYYRSPTDWALSSIGTVNVPFAGGGLDVRVTVGPSGVRLSGAAEVPGFTRVNVSGAIASSGAYELGGALNVSAGPLSLGGGQVRFFRSAVGSSRIIADAIVSLAGFNIGRASFDIAPDTGAFSVRGNLRFAGFNFSATVGRTAAGVPTLAGSISVSACAGPLCIGGSISLEFNGSSIGATFRGSGFTLGVRSNGCVTARTPRTCVDFGLREVCTPSIPVDVCF
ncbi:MAG: hypothetical protein AAF411_18020 [Myxococcota bacterium]